MLECLTVAKVVNTSMPCFGPYKNLYGFRLSFPKELIADQRADLEARFKSASAPMPGKRAASESGHAEIAPAGLKTLDLMHKPPVQNPGSTFL
eukprot:s2738_g10.t1